MNIIIMEQQTTTSLQVVFNNATFMCKGLQNVQHQPLIHCRCLGWAYSSAAPLHEAQLPAPSFPGPDMSLQGYSSSSACRDGLRLGCSSTSAVHPHKAQPPALYCTEPGTLMLGYS